MLAAVLGVGAIVSQTFYSQDSGEAFVLKVTEIDRHYRDEQDFVQQFVVQQIRSVTRNVPNQFSTLDLITERTEVSAALRTALGSAWDGTGVQVDQVDLQEIRPPKAVSESCSAAQQALVQVQAEAKPEATKVSAQQQVVQAQAQAEANAEPSKGLTSQVLQSRDIDALKSIGAQGDVIVVPQGSTPFVQVQQE